MKKFIFVLFLLLPLKGFSQNADTSDYFRIGLFGGGYVSSHAGLIEKKYKMLNSISLEAEYVKSRNLSFYFRGIYEFTQQMINYTDAVYLDRPLTCRAIFSFGGRYYLREKNIKPYFQAGLNQEINYQSSYSFYYYESNNKYTVNEKEYWNCYYSLNFGVGLDIKLCNKLSADIHYDLYRIFEGDYSKFDSYSVLTGLKYNIIY